MSNRLVDPVHFFDHLGNSLLGNQERDRELNKARAENERLRALLKRQAQKLEAPPEEVKPSLH